MVPMGGMLLVSEGVEARWARELDAAAPDRERWVQRPGGEPPDYSSIELIYFSWDVYPEHSREFAVAALKSDALRWLHTFSAGVDDPFFRTLIERGVLLTNSAGAQAVPIAQTVILYLLALSRDLPGWLEDQRLQRWNPREIRDLQGQHMVILGLGPIGQAVARLGLALGMRVTGLRRSPRGDEICPTRPVGELLKVLPDADALVVAVPLTPETRHLIDRRALDCIKAGSLLVNIARGEVVDEEALIDALREGHLAGAGLDVFREEPLPRESPLWGLRNVLITPHSSGTNPGNHLRATEIFLDNLRRYERGESLLNQV